MLLLIISVVSIFSETFYTATGFSAKNICSGHFISGFTGKSIMQEGLIPVDGSFSYVDFEIDDQLRQVSTNLFGFYQRKAVYVDGVGCSLLAMNQSTLSRKIIKLADLKSNAQLAWPDGDAKASEPLENINYQQLNESLSSAFDEPDEINSRRTKAIVVIYKGRLLVEKYASGVNLNTPLLSWSMAKSITNMQVGLLVKDGRLALKEPASVPQWKNLTHRHNQITLDHLLRMSSGLEFVEVYGMGSDAAGMLSNQASAADFAANKPVIYQPDSHWAYSSGTSNIIAGIVKRAIGGDFQQYYEYAQNRLFRPLGIDSAQLEPDASGTFIGSSYMYATARDWAKLGQLFLQDGVWNGQRLLPEGWVEYSITPTKTDPLNHYGAQFWLNLDAHQSSGKKTRTWPKVPADAYYMSGFQGQNVVVIPSKNLVIVRLGYTTPGTSSGIETLIAGVIEALPLTEETH
jgi:CubicO group peptidase (beta-lactamase class C family)